MSNERKSGDSHRRIEQRTLAVGGGLYNVYSDGTVRELFRGSVRVAKSSINGSGYSRTRIRTVTDDGRAKWVWFMTHRLVYEAFVGPIREDMTIDHIDMNKLNNSVENLEQVTLSENHRRALKKARRGNKLTEDDVRTIRVRRWNGERVCDIARDYPVTAPTISRIANHKKWAWLPQESQQERLTLCRSLPQEVA